MKIPESRLSPVSEHLIEKIRTWRNSKRVRENMLDDSTIEPHQQRIWFDNLSKTTSKEYKVFYQDSKPIGMLYFSDIDQHSCVWGCYIGEEAIWPGTGVLLAIAALDYAFNHLEVNKLQAEVFEDNTSPIRMHQAFGYKPRQDRTVTTKNGRQVRLLCFEYLQEDWKANREKVLGKMPKQIRDAAELIVFD